MKKDVSKMSDTIANNLLYDAVTDQGNVRTKNDDSIYLDGAYITSSEHDRIRNGLAPQKYHVFAVFDGIASCNYGELASRLACERLAELQEELNAKDCEEAETGEDLPPEQIMRHLLDELNIVVVNGGMTVGREIGTTVSLLLIKSNGEFCFANVGDSPSFILKRKGLLKREKLFPIGILQTLAELKKSNGYRPKKSDHCVLVNYLGKKEETGSDMAEGTYESGMIDKDKIDGFFLCSDGVTDELSKRALKKYICYETNLTCLLNKLSGKRLQDNFSAILIRPGNI